MLPAHTRRGASILSNLIKAHHCSLMHSDTEIPPKESEDAQHSRDRELRRYRRACREVDRLLDQGRLSEALRVNDEVRTLFRRLFTSGQLG